MNMPALERFINEFEYYMDVKLYVKLWIILHNYKKVDCQKESYKLLNKLKKKMRHNDDFDTYRTQIKNLEKNLLLDTRITSPKIIQKELNTLLDKTTCFSVSDLETEIKTYQKDNKKLTRLITEFKQTGSVAKFIGIKNLVDIILSAIPTPRTVGLDYDSWDKKSFQKYVSLYFNYKISKKSFLELDAIQSALIKFNNFSSNNNLLNFYTSQPHHFSFYYLYFKELTFSKNKPDKRKDRRYNKCFIMYIIDVETFSKNKNITHISLNTDTNIIDLKYYFDQAYKYTQKNNNSDNSIPIFLFHKDFPDDYMNARDLNEIPPYRLIRFDSHGDMKNIIKKTQNRKSNSSDLLSIIAYTLETILEAESEIDNKLHAFSEYSNKNQYINQITEIWDKYLD